LSAFKFDYFLGELTSQQNFFSISGFLLGCFIALPTGYIRKPGFLPDKGGI
jgi:hypothetical protein